MEKAASLEGWSIPSPALCLRACDLARYYTDDTKLRNLQGAIAQHTTSVPAFTPRYVSVHAPVYCPNHSCPNSNSFNIDTALTPFLSDLKYFLSHTAHICGEISRIATAAYQRDAIKYYTELLELYTKQAEVDEDDPSRIPPLPKLPQYEPIQVDYRR